MMFATVLAFAIVGVAQVENAGTVRRRTDKDNQANRQGGVSERMQGFYSGAGTHDADISYMREIYRLLDLEDPKNTPLYYPEDVIDGQKNLFRLMFDLVVDGSVPAYEYLDGREIFTDEYKVDVQEMLDRFGIYYTSGRNGTKFNIEEADVPTNQVLTYYIIEKWEFDRRTNKMNTRIVAICPVLNRYGDYGEEAKYPMFWVKYDQIRPYLAANYVFLSDDNNLATYSLDDYFNLGMYKGEIYKYKNLRNLSMIQMYPDPDDLARAQDSIDNRLRNYGQNLWVPTREEYLAQQQRDAALAKAKEKGDTIAEREILSTDNLVETKSSSKNNTRKRTTTKKPKVNNSAPKASSNTNADKSVRKRKK